MKVIPETRRFNLILYLFNEDCRQPMDTSDFLVLRTKLDIYVFITICKWSSAKY